MEVWRDIKGYEGLYMVSDKGRVRSFYGSVINHRPKGSLLKPATDRDGYLRVMLTKKGKQKGFGVHRLVAQAFIPNPDNLPQVNHKDENPSNDSVDNLEWCTQEYNNAYGTRMDKIRDKISVAVIATNISTGETTEFNTLYDCSRFIGCGRNTSRIYEVLNGKKKQFKGYTFKRPRKVILYRIAKMIKE